MDHQRIGELLAPFVSGLADTQLAQLSTYLDLLLRWNLRVNLTAIRDSEHIVTRHFGESLFTAAALLPRLSGSSSALDVGSGAGFPGLPLKIYAPPLRLTLIESQNRKATFLREVVRALQLENANVFCGRAEDYPRAADLVTLRAVEQFERAAPTAADRVAQRGRLALLIGAAQAERARHLLPQFTWADPLPIPLSSARILLVGQK